MEDCRRIWQVRVERYGEGKKYIKLLTLKELLVYNIFGHTLHHTLEKAITYRNIYQSKDETAGLIYIKANFYREQFYNHEFMDSGQYESDLARNIIHVGYTAFEKTCDLLKMKNMDS